MTAIGIRYLTGCVTAADLSRRGVEWPPHPARVFMALANAFFESGEHPDERQVLQWMEDSPPPAIRASDVVTRSYHETYVPVNDTHGNIIARGRRPRSFSKARILDSTQTVAFVWSSHLPPDLYPALESLCSKVTRIGHSSSLVQMWVLDPATATDCNWVPQQEEFTPPIRLRVAAPGTLSYLAECFNKEESLAYLAIEDALAANRGTRRNLLRQEMAQRFPNGRPQTIRPRLNTWHGYGPPPNVAAADIVQGPFDPDFLILALSEGRALGLESTLQLTAALRNAAMKAAGEAPPEWLTGHDSAGAPSVRPHVAFFPLPFIGHKHADGHIMGLGIAVPRTITTGQTERFALRTTLGPLLFDPQTGEPQSIHLWRNNLWDWKLVRETRESPPFTLSRNRWTGPSRVWASVTPVVLHHHPKRRPGDVERIVLQAFESALLPVPNDISIRPVSPHSGCGQALALPTLDPSDGLCRYQTHVVARFSQPLQGPVLVGRGRYRGYGLFAPLHHAKETDQ